MDILIIILAKYLIWAVLAGAAVLIGLELYKTRDWRRLGFIVLAGLTAFLLAQVFHLIPVEVFRPYQVLQVAPLIEASADSPFPSDHVMLAFAAALAALFMTRYKKLALGVLVLAVGVLVGRLLALVHSPLDVTGGVVCAAVGALIWYYIYYRESLKNLPSDIKQLAGRAKGLADRPKK
jgi:membrane-associated phospholipid phosphatase